MTELRPFQKEGVRGIYSFRGRCLLADEMGLGKTIQALDWVRRIPGKRPVVIVTPASVKYTWQFEAKDHLGMRVEVIEGRRKKRQMTLPGDIVVINYQILKSWLPALLKADPQVVVFDEVHYCKTLTSERTQASLKLVENATSVIGLSGTPMINRPIELWPILQLIRPDLFPSHEKFAWRYCKPNWTPWGWRYDGAAHTGELNRILTEQVMIRRLKKDVLPELPPKTRRAVAFHLNSAKMKEYNKASKDFLVWLRGRSPARAMRAKKSKGLTRIGYLFRLAAELKLNWTAQWIEEFFENHPGQKLVTFSMHTSVLDHLKAHFGKRAVIVDGRVSGRLKFETVRQFQNNRRVDLLLGNWIAAGAGVTLTAASNVAALDFPWTPGDLMQGEDRIHRIGQKMPCVIHYLAALGTIEEHQVKLLKKKSKILDAVLNGRASSEDFDIMRELLAELKKSW